MVQEVISGVAVIDPWRFIIVIAIILAVLAFILFMLLHFKKFYKLTKGKIIITLVLAAIIEYFLFQDVAYSAVCMECMVGKFCPPCVNYDMAWQVVEVTIIPLLFIVYSIICLIYRIFKK